MMLAEAGYRLPREWALYTLVLGLMLMAASANAEGGGKGVRSLFSRRSSPEGLLL